ncbi:HAD-IIIC family phosphatase [Mesorhizobium sp. M6A.T.Ce.TU.016.01.1.1]|uniref:HAD-IIIC family phosphatase n=1 Tax=Mesorhizobium sp. M6A.T.Ce.TU.016.01.1.1 TaxID=2496783 RepID=UPI000FC9E3BC|nr:HAD-IIIC family phosphatase [Mesorhizobium sp. M6A.T.Ce.TU.016.01.1.1]RUU32402.1 HAD-IIIC family phosphatase [Mesorhizobium sp. M6A.T.Ce.TU.016.01.1.1]
MTAPVKCVVWDLDDTLWEGTLPEGDRVRPVPDALALIDRLERAGIVQSVASRNDAHDAAEALHAHNLCGRFVYAQISWSAKSASLRRIIDLLGISADTVVFLDDSSFEREEVAAGVPGIRCYSLPEFLALDRTHELIPLKVTTDAARRPAAYREEASRREAETVFEGTPIEFLSSLGMRLTIRPAAADDFERAEELTRRTNQLNTTGRTFTAAELARYAETETRDVLVAELTDRFGDYGRIGLCLLDRASEHWTIEVLLMSCRVMGRNIGTAVLGTIGQAAANHGVTLKALFRPTPRNRQIRITYGLLGFRPEGREDDASVLAHPRPKELSIPDYVSVQGWGVSN